MSAALPTPPLCPTCGATTQVPGPQGPVGPAGPVGAVGAAGPQGPAGVGNSMLGGAGVPGAGLGNTGDWYFNTANGDVYQKTGPAVWTFRFNTVGPSGSSSAIQTSAGVPNNGTGNDGDWDLDTTTGNWYHKVTGAWVLVYTNTIALGSQVTGTLPINHGGTGQTTQQAAINGLIPGANGDIVIRTGGNVTTLASPSDSNKVLIGTNPPSYGAVPAITLPILSTTLQSTNVPWTFNHALGSVPRIWQVMLVCITGEHNYIAGDEIGMSGVDMDGTIDVFFTISSDTANFKCAFNGSQFLINDKITGAANPITFARWGLKINYIA